MNTVGPLYPQMPPTTDQKYCLKILVESADVKPKEAEGLMYIY